jgi:hypothetical protein
MTSKPRLYVASNNRLFGGKCQRACVALGRLGASQVSFACGVLKCFEVNFLSKGIRFSICGGKKFAGGRQSSASRENLVHQIVVQFRIAINTTIFNHYKPVVQIRSLKQG